MLSLFSFESLTVHTIPQTEVAIRRQTLTRLSYDNIKNMFQIKDVEKIIAQEECTLLESNENIGRLFKMVLTRYTSDLELNFNIKNMTSCM